MSVGSYWSQITRQYARRPPKYALPVQNLPGSDRSHAGLLPPLLRVALILVALEGLAYLVIGVVELASTDWGKPVVGLSTGAFFVIFGGFLLFCAWRLAMVEVWARSPIVMVQVIQIPVALSFWGGGWTTAVSVVLIVLSAITLAGVFHPASLRALADDE